MQRHVGRMLLIAALVVGGVAPLQAAPPWLSLFKRVDADSRKMYRLEEEHGPWMILVSSFAGGGGEQQAHELVMELRQRYKWSAYIHKRNYDYTEPVVGLGYDRYGDPKRMRYQHAAKFEQYAVLVGDFHSVDDPELQKTMEKIKYARPKCLQLNSERPTYQRLAVFRELQRHLASKPEKKNKGPMGSAFVTRNPLLPQEYFTPDSLEPFVVEMNSEVKHSLLENPGRYTIRVATFRGDETMDLKKIQRLQRSDAVTSRLEEAAVKANQLTLALRNQGVEAYQFHDRHESIVTVGSFESLGKTGSDGTVLQYQPPVHKVMEAYGGQPQSLPGQGLIGLKPRPSPLRGVDFDVRPLPIRVPRKSIAADYSRRSRF